MRGHINRVKPYARFAVEFASQKTFNVRLDDRDVFQLARSEFWWEEVVAIVGVNIALRHLLQFTAEC